MDPKVCVLLLLLCAALCSAEVAQDCCLRVAQQRLPARRIQSYKVQEAGRGCDISATVVQMKGGKHLCLPHPEGHLWVQRVMKMVDQREENQQQ
ncbi:C-C motif chemokine 21-like [Periophthalmus magnuspinnatus]|uniref:C-C motif chemokine 21-like n=1 Tax=Periophthalmus magnuspinnatus TaxID=409849 RepID=UPI00145A5EE2|nr:C-C motif chemokine 21-like [Periophthalmus magnuspinnatus]